jgi:hypothetical protein
VTRVLWRVGFAAAVAFAVAFVGRAVVEERRERRLRAEMDEFWRHRAQARAQELFKRK